MVCVRFSSVIGSIVVMCSISESHNYTQREAYVTLLTSIEFAQGAVVMARILRSFPLKDGEVERPFLTLVYDELLRNEGGIRLRASLETERIQIIPVPWIGEVLGTTPLFYPQYKTTYIKLHIWNLTGYDKVLYLDSDTLPLAPLSSLFDRNIGPDTVAAAPDISLPDSFNAGVSTLPCISERKFGVDLKYARGYWCT